MQAIVELALETLSYDSGPFSRELSMVAFAARPIAILVDSPAAAAGRCGLPAALVRLLDTFPPVPAGESLESQERSDELCELALKALCSLALTDGAAVVAADAVRIAMHVLSHPHLGLLTSGVSTINVGTIAKPKAQL